MIKYKVDQNGTIFIFDTMRELKAAFGLSFKEIKAAIRKKQPTPSKKGKIIISAYQKA